MYLQLNFLRTVRHNFSQDILGFGALCWFQMLCKVLRWWMYHSWSVFPHSPAPPPCPAMLSHFLSCRDCFHHHPNQVAYECYICVIRARVINFPQAWRTIPCIWLSSIVWSGASLLGWNNHILDMHGPGCTGDWPSKDTCHSSFVFVSWLPDGVIAHCYGHILFSIQNVSWRLWTPLPQGVLSRNFPSEENHSSPTAGAALGDFLFDKILHDESLS